MGEEFKSFYLTFVAAPPARNLQFEEEKAEQDLRRFRIKRRLEWEWRGGKSVIIIKWIFDASQLNIQLMYAQPNSGSAGELWRRWCGPRSRLSRWMGTQEMMRRGKSSKTLAKKRSRLNWMVGEKVVLLRAPLSPSSWQWSEIRDSSSNLNMRMFAAGDEY